ncbi:hypothetical protein [Bacillus sp. KH172YL63]|uniref:hypothetical protein n=1 Tax=Bacillus sp. KH172YL63 TaxID=2709784 RepID=UPI001564A5E1|nr:hypothetical protein [Bacillus sp. KH172YL63]
MKNKLIHETPETRIWFHPFNHPDEHRDMLEKVKISRAFNLRFRGLVEYYGDDLIAYKREQMANQKRNDFLTSFAHYMTDHLEDDCPASWKECGPSFWEELIFAYLPDTMKVTPHNNYTQQFLIELRKFVRWLDKRNETACSEVVESFLTDAFPLLKKCEILFSQLFLKNYPGVHRADWDYMNDIERLDRTMEQFQETVYGVFEVSEIIEGGIILLDLHSNDSYFTKNISDKTIDQDVMLSGVIGKRKHEFLWELAYVDGVYPRRGLPYIEMIE